MKRRLIVLALGLSFFLTACQSDIETEMNEQVVPHDDISIVITSDLHYLSPELTDYGDYFMNLIQNSDGKLTHYTPAITEAFVADVVAMNPNSVILSGDLTLNGHKKSHEGLIELLEPIVEANIPVFVIPGNHDIGGKAYSFDNEGIYESAAVDSEEFLELYDEFGYKQALSKDTSSLSYVAQMTDKVWVLMLDVNGYNLNGEIPEKTLEWVEEQLVLAEESSATVLGVSHQNLNIHNRLFQSGYKMGRADELAALYQKYNVQLHLSGHLHLQNIIENEGVTEIATSSMAITPNRFATLQINKDLSMAYSTQPVDVSLWAENKGSTDENLLNFSSYSKTFFEETTELKFLESIESLDIDTTEKKRMIAFAIDFNTHYFNGTLTEEVYDEQIIASWEKHLPNEFLTRYFNSIDESELGDKTNWKLPADNLVNN
ncbi:metallophosphoesterase [Carnobacterium pleistocenium]|uniref:metallophosphoesterase n=1 Tax=Carnobacterium pleistocenium TaxID=181073 RepID=UPI0006905C6E|nr:metallophosphoesterase [Carnobacterium pleistocenium]